MVTRLLAMWMARRNLTYQIERDLPDVDLQGNLVGRMRLVTFTVESGSLATEITIRKTKRSWQHPHRISGQFKSDGTFKTLTAPRELTWHRTIRFSVPVAEATILLHRETPDIFWVHIKVCPQSRNDIARPVRKAFSFPAPERRR